MYNMHMHTFYSFVIHTTRLLYAYALHIMHDVLADNESSTYCIYPSYLNGMHNVKIQVEARS